tara:strand:+ start:5095 stop:5517 length:423 start_codon:yes stop_codon:yes gene_type:complete
MTEEIQSGGCLCGKISYQFNKSEAISAHHCHCLDCQKSTGSGKATILLVPDSSLEIDGNLKFFTVQGSGGSHISRGFCENCGSPLISFVEENADIKFIKVGSINDSSWVNADSNFWSSTSNKWSPVDETIHSFSHNPDFA